MTSINNYSRINVDNKQQEESIGLFSSNYFVMEQSRLFDRNGDYQNMIDYLLVCIEAGSVDAMFHLANYYDEIEDYDNMLRYYEKAAEYDDVDSIYNLGHYYSTQKDTHNMLKWYLRGEELNDIDCICELAKYYESIGFDENVNEYYLKAVNLKYIKPYYLYGLFLSKKKKQLQMSKMYISGIELYKSGNYLKNTRSKIINTDNSENYVCKMADSLGIYFDGLINLEENCIKYYLIAIELGSTGAMFNLGHYYLENDDLENMFKYYLMGIEKGDVDCMFELSIYYQDNRDKENMKKYYLMALENNEKGKTTKSLVNDGEKDFNLFMVKEILESVVSENNIPPAYVLNKLKKINSKKDIMIFENKRKLFTSLNHFVECGICYETAINIVLNCGHCVCTTCYPHLYKKVCPFCRL